MAGLFCTSCNLETALGGSAGNGPFSNVAGNVTLNVGNGPAGNNTMSLLQWSFMAVPVGPVLASRAGFCAGFGLAAATPVIARATIFQVGGTQVNLCVDPDGTLSILGGSTGTELVVQSPPGTFLFNGARQYIELYVSGVRPSPQVTGTIQYEGNVVATGTGGFVSNLSFTTAWFGNRDILNGPVTVTAPLTYDSLYLLDLTGSARNSPLGKRVVTPFVSAGSGQYSQWAPNGAATSWQAVAPIPPAGDASYASSANVGDQLAVALSAPVGLQSVDFVMQRASARQDVASGGRSVALGMGNGTAVTYGATKALGSTYAGLNQVWDVDPTTGTPWTLASLLAKQLAVKTIS